MLGAKTTADDAIAYVARSRGTAFLRRLKQKPLGLAGLTIILITIVVAFFAPVIAPYDSKNYFTTRFLPPSSQYLMGTDQIGRDIFSRIVYGARVSLYVGFLSVSLGITVGLIWGMAAAYLGGGLDLFSLRIVDIITGFPTLVLALVLLASLGPSINNVVIAVIIVLIPGATRTLRSAALSVRVAPFIEAASAIGCSQGRILFRHILPNILAPYIVLLTINLGHVIVLEASLSFLGVGVPAEEASWGGMLTYAAQQFVAGTAPWLAIFPGLALTIVVFGFNLAGDAARDLFDPRMRRG